MAWTTIKNFFQGLVEEAYPGASSGQPFTLANPTDVQIQGIPLPDYIKKNSGKDRVVAADFVEFATANVNHGNEFWSWRKWDSGWAEASYYVKMHSETRPNVYSAIYSITYNIIYPTPCPITFVENPYVVAKTGGTKWDAQTKSGIVYMRQSSGNIYDPSTGVLTPAKVGLASYHSWDNNVDLAAYYRVDVKGRWK